jgi:hypothetical protein
VTAAGAALGTVTPGFEGVRGAFRRSQAAHGVRGENEDQRARTLLAALREAPAAR